VLPKPAALAALAAPAAPLWACYLANKGICNEHAFPASKAEKSHCVSTGLFIGGTGGEGCPKANQLGQCYSEGGVRFTLYKSKEVKNAAEAEIQCAQKHANFFPATP
jgi:hypothetical protein